MSYYNPSFSQTAAMTRGRGYPRGSFRGSSRGGSSWNRGYSSRGGGRNFDSYSDSFDGRSKYGSSDRYSGSRGYDDYRKPYRIESYSGRDSGHRTPERKRPRIEAPSSRHESSYGGGYGSSASRYESSYSSRRGFSSERHPASFSRRSDEFRRPSGPPRGGYRGRISSRGSRGLKFRDRAPRRRLIESSYAVRKRIFSSRAADYARRLKISKLRSAIAARTKNETSDKESGDEETIEENTSKDDLTKQDGDEEENSGTVEKNDSLVKEDAEAKDEENPRKTYIKLNCPHCGIKTVTFRKYEIHLLGRTHMFAMRKVAIKQKSILAQMRAAQRNNQNELEKSGEDLASRTQFCPLCKLNYKQHKAVHQESEAHKNMKKFLMPYCKVCSISFKSPMMYENHSCSIEHLKRKQRIENGDNSDEYDEETNLENFTTIDSVGVDGEASEDDQKKKVVPKKEVKEPKELVNVGIEQIVKVEAYYCDLCKMYVGRGSEELMEPILTRHCKQRTHMQRYIRYKEHKDLEKRAERLQRKETAEKEVKDKKVKEESVEKEEDDEAVEVGAKTEDGDVEKELDLLTKSGNKSSDEDEDVNGERYDRFKYSEKNGDEKDAIGETEKDSVVTVAPTEETATEKE